MRGECERTLEEKYIDFLELYNLYSCTQIKKRLKLSSEEFDEFLSKAVKANITENKYDTLYGRKTAYSDNEDDYGIKYIGIRKYEIREINTEPDELQTAIKNYLNNK